MRIEAIGPIQKADRDPAHESSRPAALSGQSDPHRIKKKGCDEPSHPSRSRFLGLLLIKFPFLPMWHTVYR